MHGPRDQRVAAHADTLDCHNYLATRLRAPLHCHRDSLCSVYNVQATLVSVAVSHARALRPWWCAECRARRSDG